MSKKLAPIYLEEKTIMFLKTQNLLNKAWDFVEINYPNYIGSNEIARNNDLFKLLLEYDKEDKECSAYNLLVTDYQGDINNPQIKIDYDYSLKEIYEKSILSHIEKYNQILKNKS